MRNPSPGPVGMRVWEHRGPKWRPNDVDFPSRAAFLAAGAPVRVRREREFSRPGRLGRRGFRPSCHRVFVSNRTKAEGGPE